MTDEKYMRLAIELAQKGCGWVSPNPMVGAVIVKDGRIIGQGYHKRYGSLHAEREALGDCMKKAGAETGARRPAEGADMYVTLEPCCHHGKQPPCTEAIIEAGIRKVIIGSADPNPLVAGKGVVMLREHGVEVTEGFLKDECDSFNRPFFYFITNGTPYVVLKYAMTADGKIAAHTGASKWITGEAARENVHRDRNRYTAIMTGVGTVLADDPLLTCRIRGGRDPVRIICDTSLRIPSGSQIVKTAGDVRTMIATSEEAAAEKAAERRRLEEAGCEIITVPLKDGHTDLGCLMERLGEMKIDSVLLEGGAALNWSALSAGIVNRVQAYVAPKILGGKDAPSPVGGRGFDMPSEAVMLSEPEVTVLGKDILLESEVLETCSRG